MEWLSVVRNRHLDHGRVSCVLSSIRSIGCFIFVAALPFSFVAGFFVVGPTLRKSQNGLARHADMDHDHDHDYPPSPFAAGGYLVGIADLAITKSSATFFFSRAVPLGPMPVIVASAPFLLLFGEHVFQPTCCFSFLIVVIG